MSRPQPLYTKITHNATYEGIDPRRPELSTAGKVVLITGASAGIGRAAAASFARSGPKALILLGRKTDALAETAAEVEAAGMADGYHGPIVRTHAVDVLDAPELRAIMASVAEEFGGIDVLVHSAGHLPPVAPLLTVDPANFLKEFETTVTGTLAVAQALLLANGATAESDITVGAPTQVQPQAENSSLKPVTFVNLTTAGALFPPFKGMGTYVTCKLAALKMLQAISAENPQMHLVNVHPGFVRTNMSAQLAKSVTLPLPYNDMSLSSDFLVWAASPEADFLRGKIVYASWDVEELKERKAQIMGLKEMPGSGELFLGFQGFPRYMGGTLLGPAPASSTNAPGEDDRSVKRNRQD